MREDSNFFLTEPALERWNTPARVRRLHPPKLYGSVPRVTFAIFLWNCFVLASCADLIPRDTQSLVAPRLQRSEIFGFVAGLGTTFGRRAGSGRDAEAPLQHRHESQDGGHHGYFPNSMGLLRSADRVAAGDCLECRSGAHQFSLCCRILLFCQQREA